MTDHDRQTIITALTWMAEDVYDPDKRADILRLRGELEDERLRERGERLL